MGICLLKYSGLHWVYFALCIGGDNFFMFVSALNLVYFSDLLIVEYTYLCLRIKVEICSF